MFYGVPSVAAATMNIGCFLGCLLAGPLMDKIGRKKLLMIVTSANFALGFALIMVANSPALIIAGRRGH